MMTFHRDIDRVLTQGPAPLWLNTVNNLQKRTELEII